MTQDEFYYLYINANSILDLGMQDAARDIEALFASGELDELAELADQEIMSDEQLAKQFEGMNKNALDGIELDFFSRQVSEGASETIETGQGKLSAEQETQLDNAFELELNAMTAELENVKPVDDMENQETFNIDTYMSNIYAEEEVLEKRTKDAFNKADTKQLQAELAKLPPNLASLCSKLSGEQLMSWVEVHDKDNDALDNIIIAIRQLDF